VVLSADGDFGDFGLTLRTTRYGKVIAPGATAPIGAPLSLTELGPDDILLGAKWITDLELRYDGIENLQLAVGADNLFDIYPDRSPFGARPAAVGGFYPINQYICLFGLLALRLQRPLPLRPRLDEVLVQQV
jgi:iron complex outermembrane receptor protein